MKLADRPDGRGTPSSVSDACMRAAGDQRRRRGAASPSCDERAEVTLLCGGCTRRSTPMAAHALRLLGAPSRDNEAVIPRAPGLAHVLCSVAGHVLDTTV